MTTTPLHIALKKAVDDLGMDIPHVHHWGKLCAEWLQEMGI